MLGSFSISSSVFSMVSHNNVSSYGSKTPVYQAQAGNMPSNQNFNSYNNFENNSQNNNNNQNSKVQNPFLEYYTRQGSKLFNDKSFFFFQEGKKLVKRFISVDNLKKSLVIFFGDWCPHCKTFLTAFSKSIELLRLSGINIIFIAVPTIDKLRDWKDPNIDDFNNAENKIASFGIKLSHKQTFVTLIADRMILANCGIEGLPVIIAVKNGEERYRAVGENAIRKLDLSNQNTLQQFLEIWDDDNNNENSSSNEKINNKHDDSSSLSSFILDNNNDNNKDDDNDDIKKNKQSSKISKKHRNLKSTKKIRPAKKSTKKNIKKHNTVKKSKGLDIKNINIKIANTSTDNLNK